MNGRKPVAPVNLTGRELDALHGILALVLNDPDLLDDAAEVAALARVDDKVVRAIRAATS